MKNILRMILSFVLGGIIILVSVYIFILIMCLLYILMNKFVWLFSLVLGVPCCIIFVIIMLTGAFAIGDTVLESIQKLVKVIKNK